MKKNITLGILGFLVLAIILGSDVRFSQGRKNEEQLYRNLELFVGSLKIVQDNYVDQVDDKKLIYGALKGMLFSLDPYSAFLEPEMQKELQIETQGEFEGVGMEITVKDSILTVVSPIEDTPAWKAGIKSGDRIIEIDGQSSKGLTSYEAAKKLRGKRGTSVTLSIVREGTPKLLKIVITRDVILVKSVRSKDIEGFAYIRLNEFQERSSKDLEAVVAGYAKNNTPGIILDLRNNPGGLLSAAIEISELFIPSGKLIVYTQGRDPKDRTVYYSRGKPLWDKPVVLLVNGGSASASEIVFGAMKDNLTAFRSVGNKTFGKGSVQNVIQMKDGSAIKLTIARYYTPKGICIEGKGIMPDIEMPIKENDEESTGDGDKNQIKEKDTEPFVFGDERDVQLKKAVEELKILTTKK